MTTDLLDVILHTYITMLNVGFRNLLPISVGLLAFCAVFELRLAFLHATIDGYVDFVRLFGMAFMPLILTAVLAFFVQSAVTWTDEALEMFLSWGSAVANVHIGNSPIGSALSSPSTVFNLGFALAEPLWIFMKNLRKLLTSSDAWFIMVTYWLCWIGTIIWFAIIALDIMVALIEFKVASVASLVLLPWGAFRHTSFLMWVSWEWLAGVGLKLFAIVMLVSGAVLAIGTFSPLLTTATQDPTPTSAVVLLVASFFLASVTHTVPVTVASRVGGGGLGGGSLLWAAFIPTATIQASGQVYRGVSNLVR